MPKSQRVDRFARATFPAFVVELRRVGAAMRAGRGALVWDHPYMAAVLATEVLRGPTGPDPPALPTERRGVCVHLRERAARFSAWLRTELELEEQTERERIALEEWCASPLSGAGEREGWCPI